MPLSQGTSKTSLQKNISTEISSGKDPNQTCAISYATQRKNSDDDQEQHGSSREVDANGYMVVRGCPVSSWGVFQYGAGQIGAAGDPNRIVNVYRPKSAVSDSETIASFEDLPLIDDHEYLSGDPESGLTDPVDKGVHGIMTGKVWFSDPWLRADVKVFSQKLRSGIASGKVELSLGYACKFVEQSGVAPDGQSYEFVQTDLRGNHIALVSEARVPGARILDGLCFDHLDISVKPSNEGRENMSKKEKEIAARAKRPVLDSSAIKQLQALIPALKQFLSEEAAEPEHQGQIQSDEDPEMEPKSPDAESSETEQEEVAQEETPIQGEEKEPVVDQDEDLISLLKAVLAKVGPPDPVCDDAEEPDAEPSAEAEDDEPESKQEKAKCAEDAAIKNFYKDLADKEELYERLSVVVGAFDHKAMDSKAVGVYGLKKLGISAPAGAEAAVLGAYLKGAEKTAAARPTVVADSKFSANSEIAQYLKGAK